MEAITQPATDSISITDYLMPETSNKTRENISFNLWHPMICFLKNVNIAQIGKNGMM